VAVDVARELAVLLSVAFVGYLLAAFTRQSVVIGEILVGLAVGPSLLGLIQPGDFVEGLALMGAIVLLFVVGLQHEFHEIFRGRYALIALAGVVVPWLGGYAFALASGYPFLSALFIGTALTATSIAITANVLVELGRLQSEAGKAILGAAVIDDVLGLVALALTIQLAQQGSVQLPQVAWLIAKAALLIVVGGYGGKRLAQPLLERVDRSRIGERHPTAPFLLAMNIAFVYALASELLGLSGIVGAFLAGVALTKTRSMRGRSFREGAEYLTTILASIFFVSLGVLVDLHQVSLAIVPFVLALTLIAMLTKFVGCALPARALGLGWRESALVGVGMAPRGEVALIAALLALRAGAVGQEVYTAVVLMSLFTTLATPPLLKALAGPAPRKAPHVPA
jgi:Kef-type K+ transport system membrane component KefB